MISTPSRRTAAVLRCERLEPRDTPAAGFLRVVSYNITAGNGSLRTGFDTILRAIGDEAVGGRTGPVDLIALQEVQAQGTATQAVVNLLNGVYGAGVYARGSLDGDSTGSGTQRVVYNTQTLQLVGEAAVGTASTAGQPRQTLRYRLRPVGESAASDFCLYNSHAKSADDSASANRRLVEANAIRADADALGDGVAVLYVGDFNTYRSSEAGYQRFFGAGAGQAFDPINAPGSWHENAAFRAVFTQAPSANPPSGLTGGGLDDRFDFILTSGEFADGAGLDYVAGSHHTFGNDGSVDLKGSINDPSSTALPGLPNRT